MWYYIVESRQQCLNVIVKSVNKLINLDDLIIYSNNIICSN